MKQQGASNEQEDNKRMIRGSDNNTRMCLPMPCKTAVYTAQAGQQMALQSTQIAHPMGDEDCDHVTRKKRIQPTTDKEPNFDQNP